MDFASVGELSGIQAGDGGFQVNAKGNTDLKGGGIASTDKAMEEGKNSLVTKTLSQSDVHNKAEFSASSISLAGSMSMSSNDGKYSGKSADSSNTSGARVQR